MRGRLVASGLAGIAALATLAMLGLTAADAALSSRRDPPPSWVRRSVVVQPGDTLWAIASRAQPTGDPRIVIQQIIDVNALHGTAIRPGERLWVPKG